MEFTNGISEKLELAFAEADERMRAERDRETGRRFEAWFMRLAGMCVGCSSAEELELKSEALCLSEWAGECPSIQAETFANSDFGKKAYPSVNYRFFSADSVRRIREVFTDFTAAAWVNFQRAYLGLDQVKALVGWMVRRPALRPFVDSVAGMYEWKIRHLRASLRQCGKAYYALTAERVVEGMAGVVTVIRVTVR